MHETFVMYLDFCYKDFQMDTTDILIKIRKIVRSVDIESKKIRKNTE